MVMMIDVRSEKNARTRRPAARVGLRFLATLSVKSEKRARLINKPNPAQPKTTRKLGVGWIEDRVGGVLLFDEVSRIECRSLKDRSIGGVSFRFCGGCKLTPPADT